MIFMGREVQIKKFKLVDDIEGSAFSSGFVFRQSIEAGLKDPDSRVRASAIRVGIQNNMVTPEEADRALDDIHAEVRLAAIRPAILYGLASPESIKRIFVQTRASVSTLDERIEARIALIGFYHGQAEAGNPKKTVSKETLEEDLADKLISLESVVEVVYRSNDFKLVNRLTDALISFYSESLICTHLGEMHRSD